MWKVANESNHSLCCNVLHSSCVCSVSFLLGYVLVYDALLHNILCVLVLCVIKMCKDYTEIILDEVAKHTEIVLNLLKKGI